ncbi:hypothetical protein PAXINDRAFT_76234, partial [Paxillus involutus ATCC 200175]
GFRDITNGTNPGCGTLSLSAAEVWDPVTGVGTPNFPHSLTGGPRCFGYEKATLAQLPNIPLLTSLALWSHTWPSMLARIW